MLTDQHIHIIKSTIPLLEQAGSALTEHFYARMFRDNPELQHIFNMSNQHNGRQQVALFEAIAAYAKNIENLAALSSAVERIAQKHTSMSIQPEHYEIVGHHLIETLRELATEAFNAEVEEAWTAAYLFLAQVFIGREAQLYKSAKEAAGGWEGGREFVISEKKVESKLVTSFVMTPVDGKAVLDFLPGQYIGIETQPKHSEYREKRQYSLSDKPNGINYRISVKREIVPVAGLVSNHLHDSLNVGDKVLLNPPAGDFYFKDRARPVALLSAGVGATPMQSMLETLTAQNYGQSIHYLHACENAEQHSFQTRNLELAKQQNVDQHSWYAAGTVASENGNNGFMNLLDVGLDFGNTDFYMCGPLGFMQFMKVQLLELGAPNEQIHYEVFGPHESF